jgi:predicted nucleotidyltransferase
MAETELFEGALLARLLAGFATLPGLAGMLLIGSGARGWADYFSDLDLLCVWDPAPDRPRRYPLLRELAEQERSAPQLLRFERLELDRLRMGRREVELVHLGLPALEALVTAVVDRLEVERYAPDRYGFWAPLSWLQTGVPLDVGDDRLRALRERTAQLSDPLVEKLIAQQFAALKLPVLYHLQKAALRGDGLFLHSILDDIVGHLLRALFAFNGRFFPGARWLQQELAGLRYQPPRLYERLMGMLETAPQFARDIPPVALALVRELAQMVSPFFPEAVPAWAA